MMLLAHLPHPSLPEPKGFSSTPMEQLENKKN